MNLTDFYVDIVADISNTGTSTSGFSLNLVTNSSAARDLSNQNIATYGIYSNQWDGFAISVDPYSNKTQCFSAMYNNGTFETIGSQGPYADLRIPMRFAVSVTNGSSLSVSYIF